MGTEGVMVALVTFSMHKAFVSRDERIQAAFRGIWQHSLAVALVAKDLSQRIGPGAPDPNTAYLGGLLHDVGKPVVASLLLEAEKLYTKDSGVKWMNEGVWKRVVDESHRKVGMALARKWQLPDDLTRAIEQSREYEPAVPRSTANVVRLANAMAKKHGLYMGDVDQVEIERAITTGRGLIRVTDELLVDISKGLYSRVGTLLDGKPETKPRVSKHQAIRT
jgi:putative nucleotidyltransferase with HDIG domain